MLEVRALLGQLDIIVLLIEIDSLYYWYRRLALLAQSVEAIDLGSIQCGFESRGGHSGRMHITTSFLTASSLLDLE